MQSGLAILGAGIGGLAAALACQSADIPFQLYDDAESPLQGGAALTLWPNAINALTTLGALPAKSVDNLYAVRRGDVRTDRNLQLYQLPIEWMRSRYGFAPVCFLRSDVLSQLYSALGHPPIQRKRIMHVDSMNREVKVTFDDGSMAVFDGVISADGIYSSVRQQCFHTTPRKLHYTAWRGIANGGDIPAHSMREYWGNGIRFGYAKIDVAKTYWFATANVGLLPQAEDEWWNHVQSRLMQFPSEVGRCLEHTNSPDILHHAVQDIPPGTPMSIGNIALIGDAAHAITPNLGFGACLALEDAQVLATELRTPGLLSRRFASYSQKRRTRVAFISRSTRWLGHVMQSEHSAVIAARWAAVKVLPVPASHLAWSVLLGKGRQ